MQIRSQLLAFCLAGQTLVGPALAGPAAGKVTLAYASVGDDGTIQAYIDIYGRNGTDKVNKAFTQKCRAGAKVYVAELGTAPFRCSIQNDGETSYELLLEPTIRSKPRWLVKMSPGEPIITLSFTAMEQPHVAVDTISPDDYRQIDPLLRSLPARPTSDPQGDNYVRIKDRRAFEAKGGERGRTFVTSAGRIYIVPLYKVESALDEDRINAVFIKTGAGLQYKGEIRGCFERVGADIDQDGIPEVVTEICEGGEGKYASYYRIAPSIQYMLGVSLGGY